MRGFPEVAEYLVEVRRRSNGSDELLVKLELKADAPAGKTNLADALREALMLSVNVEFVAPGALPRGVATSGRLLDRR